MAKWGKFLPDKPILAREHLPNILALAVAVLVTLTILLSPIDVRQLVKLGYVGIFLANLLGGLTVIFPTPAIMAAFVGGILLNPIWAGLLAGLGSGLGEINGYLAGYGGKAAIENRDQIERFGAWIARNRFIGKLAMENRDHYERFTAWIVRNRFIGLFVLAALPNPLFDVAGITAGLMGFPFFEFVLATCAGKMVKGLTLAFLGARSSGLLDPVLR